MPYKVLKDGVTLDKQLTTRKQLRTGKEVPVVRSIVYLEGDYVPDEDLSDYLTEQYKEDNGKIREKIEKVSQKEYDEYQAASTGIIDAYQAENGGPVDEPRKIRQALTKSDLETDKAKVLESESSKQKAKKVEVKEEEVDLTEVETGGSKRSANSGDVDEPRKDGQAYTKVDEDNEAKQEVLKKGSRSKSKKG